MIKKVFFVKIVLFVFAFHGVCQDNKLSFTDVRVSGYFRNFITYRNMIKNYTIGGPLAPKTFIVNGLAFENPGGGFVTGYREPLLMLNFQGKPTENTSFEVDYLLDNQMTGEIFNTSFSSEQGQPTLTGNPNAGAVTFPRRLQSYRWINFGGNLLTDVGNFEMKAGGVIFTTFTALTMSNYLYRDDMFERYPWEWQTTPFKRYITFFEDKSVATDSRFNNGAIQGVWINATQLPYRFSGKFAYGKTNTTGGWQSFFTNNNQNMLVGQVLKNFGTHSLSVNYFQTKNILKPQRYDYTAKNVVMQQVATTELKLNFFGVNLQTESGVGSVMSPFDTIKIWDPAIISKIVIGNQLVKMPISLQYFYIGPNVLNFNSSVLNTSNTVIQADYGLPILYNTAIFEGAVTEFSQLANNRQGINVTSAYEGKNLRFSLALSTQQEIYNLHNLISYQHRLNGFTRSQFVYYRNGVGPYARHTNAWRRSWEKIPIVDGNLGNYRKGFNLIDVSLKYKTLFLGRQIIFSNYVNYNSVQKGISPLAKFDDKAFLRNLYEEFMIFYHIFPKVSVLGLAGVERSLGNQSTILGENGKPIDQTGYGYGLGLDFDINQTTGFYLRQRWFSFADKNFILDRFKGYDFTVELKIFF
jgi:hypothetical protein